MQIVAHPDDDLLFINPDLQIQLAEGLPSVTIVTTAAEADGGATSADAQRAVFAGLRQDGLRAAYAAMAGVANSWSRTSLTVAGHPVEYDQLSASPAVRLVFLNFCDSGDDSCSLSLLTLDGDTTAVRSTMVVNGGVVRFSVAYTHALLRQTLLELMQTFQPGHFNLLDPDPQLICGPVPPGDNCYGFLDDNPDHIATTHFADEALAAYDGPAHAKRYDTFYHRGYALANYRGNLGADDYTRKRGICDVYKAYDSNFRANENGYLGEFGATWERYWGGTRWLQPLADGRLAAFAVQARQVVWWHEDAIEGTWTGPTLLGGGPVAPHVEVVRYANGRLRLFALGMPLGGAQDVLTCVETGPNAGFGPWTDIGRPQGADAGVPAAVIDASDKAVVFARNFAGGVSVANETASGWTAWSDLAFASGDDIQDGLAAIRAGDGLIDVFGAYRSGNGAHWRQSGGGYALDGAFPVYNVIAPPTVTRNSDGRLEIFYREAGSAGPPPGDVFTAFVTPSGSWSTNLVDLGGFGGIGPIAAMLRPASGQIMLFGRNAYHGIDADWQSAPNTSFLTSWQDLGGVTPAFPAAAADGFGHVAAAVVGTDGVLYIQREVALGSTGSFNGWFPVGEAPSQASVPASLGARDGSLQARPSVVRDGTDLVFDAPLHAAAELTIHDLGGRVVRRLPASAGAASVRWDGADAAGRRVAAGLYFVRATAPGFTATGRVIVVE